jgi:hypothetical protein
MSITDRNSISILASTPSPQPDDHILDDILVDDDGSTHENEQSENERTIPQNKPTRGFDDDSDDADELMISQLEEMNEAMASDLAEQDRLMAEKKKIEMTRKISEENQKIHEKMELSEEVGKWYEPEDEAENEPGDEADEDREKGEKDEEDGHKNFMTEVPIDEEESEEKDPKEKGPEENTDEKIETKPEIQVPLDPFLGIPIDDDSEPEEEVLQTGQVSAAFGGPTPTKRAKISLDLVSGVVSSDHESEDNDEPSTFAQTLQSRFQPKQPKTPVFKSQPFSKQSSILKQSSSNSSSSTTRRDPRQKPASRPDFSSVNVPISSSVSKKVGAGGGEKPGKKSPNSDATILKLKHIAKQFYDSIMKCDPAWRRFDSVKGIKAIYRWF